MISITVHHHNTHLAAIAANACTGKETISSSSSSSSSSYPPSSASSNLSSPSLESNVEVQYKARFFQEKEQEHSKQTIKFKQVNSNQLTETTTSSTTKDLNNNSNNMSLTDSNNINNNNISLNCKLLPEEICDEKQPINLHSRSISLVINPEQQQQQHQQDYSPQRLARRRSMPRLARRTRLRLATEATVATTTQHLQKQAPLEPEPKRKLEAAKLELLQPIETQPGELNLTGQQKEEAKSEEKAGKEEEEETEQEQARCSLKQELNETNNSSHIKEAHDLEIEVAKLKEAQSFERLRQAGVFLREISDEFAK